MNFQNTLSRRYRWTAFFGYILGSINDFALYQVHHKKFYLEVAPTSNALGGKTSSMASAFYKFWERKCKNVNQSGSRGSSDLLFISSCEPLHKGWISLIWWTCQVIRAVSGLLPFIKRVLG